MDIFNYEGQNIKISRGLLPERLKQKKLAPGELFFDYEDNLLYIGPKDGNVDGEVILVAGANSIIWQGEWSEKTLPDNPQPGFIYKISENIDDKENGYHFVSNDFIMYVKSQEGGGKWLNITGNSGGGTGVGSAVVLIDQDTMILPPTIASVEGDTLVFDENFEKLCVEVDPETETISIKNTTVFAMEGSTMHVRNY